MPFRSKLKAFHLQISISFQRTVERESNKTGSIDTPISEKCSTTALSTNHFIIIITVIKLFINNGITARSLLQQHLNTVTEIQTCQLSMP